MYWLGSTYNFQEGVLGTTDFNCMMDLQALHVLFKSEVEMHVIPVNVAVKMEFDYEKTSAQLKDKHPLTDFLINRWDDHLDGSRKNRIIWDLALIEAIIHPEWAEEVSIKTSKDYGNKIVGYYKNIDPVKMQSDFFEQLLNFLNK